MMETDFIPATCPNCGGKLQVDPAVDNLTCQFCGTEHLIRRNVTGAVTLEAFARCPLCRRNDRSEKVSAILKNQVAQTQGTIAQQRVYTVNGQAFTRTENVPIHTTQSSDLARHLAPPPAPVARKGGGSSGVALVFAIILILVAGCGLLTALYPLVNGTGSDTIITAAISVLLCAGLPGLLGVGLFVLWYYLRKKDKEKAAQMEIENTVYYRRWQQALARWQKLYYCGRDDILFIPGEKASASVGDMLTYIYSQPDQ